MQCLTSSSMKSSGFCFPTASTRCERDETNDFGAHPAENSKQRPLPH